MQDHRRLIHIKAPSGVFFLSSRQKSNIMQSRKPQAWYNQPKESETAMAKEIRTACFDPHLKIEAYRFEGIRQTFPNHFHDYYVIGFIEKGKRSMRRNHADHLIGAGDIILLNPGDAHTCEQTEVKTLDYRCLNISEEIMRRAAEEITGRAYLPRFTRCVLYRSELAESLRELHRIITEEAADFKKEELFLFLIGQLLRECTDGPFAPDEAEPSAEISAVCAYMEEHFTETIRLDTLSALAGFSKYHLLRSFTRQKGISPYSFLETLRIARAKRLLEQGAAPVEVALQTGFSDQSHFSNFFKKLIGLTPKQYSNIFSGASEAAGESGNEGSL